MQKMKMKRIKGIKKERRILKMKNLRVRNDPELNG
jgi:hypothetical protein